MSSFLVVSVHFLTGRYHGERDGFSQQQKGWPPSPARLFQAIIAGNAEGNSLKTEFFDALQWLENQHPPRIFAPPSIETRTIPQFVPNNNLDLVKGDPQRVNEIRTPKSWSARLINSTYPLHYIWEMEGTKYAETVCNMAENLYQLGRGIDSVYAYGRVLDATGVKSLCQAFPGAMHSPTGVGSVPVAMPGSLKSLDQRYNASRFEYSSRQGARVTFHQPPKAIFKHVGYDVPTRNLLFDLRKQNGMLSPKPLVQSGMLTIEIRNTVAQLLTSHFPEEKDEISKFIVGRGAGPSDFNRRIKIVPLPSIGTRHTDPSIRRILVEVPINCPFRIDDLRWAFSQSLSREEIQSDLVGDCILNPSTDDRMRRYYSAESRLFRTITPAALSASVPRDGTNGLLSEGSQRQAIENKTIELVRRSLGHIGVYERPRTIRVRREPWHLHGAHSKEFGRNTRFNSSLLWHVELGFSDKVKGPLLLGDGRFNGLGLMIPECDTFDGVLAGYLLNGKKVPVQYARKLVQALRRALMSRSKVINGTVPKLFSGHEPNGDADQTKEHDHVYLSADNECTDSKEFTRVTICAPWVMSKREPKPRERRTFQDVVESLSEIRSTEFGRLRLGIVPLLNGDPLIGPGKAWHSQTSYLCTRHLHKQDEIEEFVRRDVIGECKRKGLPEPKTIHIVSVDSRSQGGRIEVSLQIRFATAQTGPILLGRDSHVGGGVFHIS